MPGVLIRNQAGEHYVFIAVAIHTESGDSLAIYSPLDNANMIFARPLFDMFHISKDKVGNMKAKFEIVGAAV